MILLMLLAVAIFVGSQVCQPCHAEIAKSYAQTPMARSSGRARQHLQRAKPFDAEVQLRLAALESNPARAQQLYESVLRTNPASPAALVNLGSLYAGAGRLEEAAKFWYRALEVNPGIEQAVLNLAGISKPAEARALLVRYLELNPGSKAARDLLSKQQ